MTIFHCTETETNVIGTNVPKTVPNSCRSPKKPILKVGKRWDKIGVVLAEILHCTETGANAAGTKTVANSCRGPKPPIHNVGPSLLKIGKV